MVCGGGERRLIVGGTNGVYVSSCVTGNKAGGEVCGCRVQDIERCRDRDVNGGRKFRGAAAWSGRFGDGVVVSGRWCVFKVGMELVGPKAPLCDVVVVVTSGSWASGESGRIPYLSIVW